MSLIRASSALFRSRIPNALCRRRRHVSTAAFVSLQPARTIDRCESPARRARRYYATGPPGDVAVIGGGITGLTAAYYLARWLPASSRVTLYEGAGRLGGWIHTVKKETDGGAVH